MIELAAKFTMFVVVVAGALCVMFAWVLAMCAAAARADKEISRWRDESDKRM